jgi:hypothetical protein
MEGRKGRERERERERVRERETEGVKNLGKSQRDNGRQKGELD